MRQNIKLKSGLKPLGVSKREFITQSLPFWVVDFGDRTVATFNYETGSTELPEGVLPVGQPATALPFVQGLNELEIPLTDGSTFSPFRGALDAFTFFVNSTSLAVVTDITLVMDSFASSEDTDVETIRSFGQSYSLLEAGALTIFTPPFPVTYPIASGLSLSGGFYTRWSQSSPQDQLAISANPGATHGSRGALAEAVLPPAGRYRVSLDIPNVSINGSPYRKNGRPAAYFWSGIVTGTALVTTSLGQIQKMIDNQGP